MTPVNECMNALHNTLARESDRQPFHLERPNVRLTTVPHCRMGLLRERVEACIVSLKRG
jgi:hypothetical protein